MTNLELAKKILELSGGKENIANVSNCMTRLRLIFKDETIVSKEAFEKIEGVLGVVQEQESFQIVLGPGKVKKVADCFNEEIGAIEKDSSWQDNKQAIKDKQKTGKVKAAIKMISEIFIPLLPAIIAAGLFNGFASLIGQLIAQGTIAGNFWELTRLLFSLIGSGFLGYFAIYTGIRSAEVFGATPALGGMVGAISIGANIVEISKMIGLFNEAVPLESILTTGKGGIIGVIFAVYILAKIEKAIRKVVPDVLYLIVTPFVSMLIIALLLIFVIMPVAGFLSDGIVVVLSAIIQSSNPVIRVLSGFILSAVFLPMVLLGLHHGLIPIYAIQLEAFGGVSLFPVLAMAGAGQVGAAIAIYLVAKKVNNQKLKGIITGALPAGFLGVGEPLIYGVTLPLGKPFITAGLGAGFGGAWVMLSEVMAASWGPSGLVAIPLMISTSGMLNFFIGLVISYVMGFIITKLVIKDKEIIEA
ncbi:MAG: PTS transporter subunit EIIC [Anaerorhabdus sp.]